MADEIQDDGPSTRKPPSRPTPASTSATSGPKPTASLDRGGPARTTTTTKPTGVAQPKPQPLPKRTSPASIIVSPRQKGNPLLTHIRSLPWEYGDTPADYHLGLTTGALFLSLKYHRLHPEYIYTRLRHLQGKYHLRVLLVMVDIPNHEDPLRELSKTSLVNGVTLILCWSAAEGGRYLELFKTYENAAPTAIRAHQRPGYADRMTEFVTTPRSVNRADAVALVSQFGTVRTAVNARFEEVSLIAGWGEKKVQGWCRSVREPFRVRRAGRRGGGGVEGEMLRGLSQGGMSRGSSRGEVSRSVSQTEDTEEGNPGLSLAESEARHDQHASPAAAAAAAAAEVAGNSDASARRKEPGALRKTVEEEEQEGNEDDEAAMAEAMMTTSNALPPPSPPEKRADHTDADADADADEDAAGRPPPAKRKKLRGSTREGEAADSEAVSDGVMAALSKLRKEG